MCCKTIATALCHVLPEKEDCQVTIIDSALLNVGCGICDITITASKDTVGCDIFVDFDNNLSSSCAIVCEGSSRLANINFCIINIPIISSFKLIKARNDSLIIFNVGVEVPQNKFVNDILLGMTLVYVGGGSVQISQMHLANLNFFSNPIQISNFEQFVIAESTFVDISIKSSSFITFLNESSFDQKSLLINSTNFTRVNAIDNQPSVLSSTVGLIFNICDSFFISCNANDRKGSAMEFHNSVSISIAGCTFIGSLMLNSASSSLSFLPYPQELSAGQYFEEEEYASCGWSHSLVYIFNAKCSCTNTRFLFSERGALAVSESNLNITNCTFAGNSALDNDFPHIRHNILCESHSEIQLSSLSSGDGTHNKVDNYDVPFSTSLWLLQNNCEVHSALSEDIPSLYFVPLITQASYSTNPADSSSYKLMVNGSSFFPCGIRVALRCGNDSPENWVNISSFALDNENTITASISPAQFKCKLQHLKKSSEKNTPTLSVALIYPTSLLMDTVQKLPSTLSSSTSKYDSDFSQIDFLVTPFVPLSTSLTKSFPWYFVVIPVGSITFIVIIIATIVAIVRWKRRSDEETDQIVTLGSEALFDVKEVTHKELRKMNRKKLKKLPNLITSESSTVTSSSYSSSEESYSTIDSADSEHLQSSDEGNFSEEVDENELGFKEKKAQDISSRTLEQKSSGNFLTHFFKTNFRFMRKKDQYSLLGLDEHNSCSPYGSFETTIN
ncbi:uncharacterized protein MONOS_1952 [Monocercomonoides exilis]|uniref:uncharacterized protein n=1 Tax=Monocercomonoides exilis TaxID=2049356 RepID=UPI003559E4C8|nr:hypothetical protein MONOS_1952 [Monocercomonoides exilis]|eukprot:MONOS_1952.1-p1 / transcript=MONOS_1952.1 / gene=MONOS_1952 / organism=Monocercomonoides_exilis_PA203 / gene_product=unspecified product / transcript_product=unspecified product / location=Mono_scaffold00037:137144-139330(+) / protein_length=729 / sequence_SO=supercontig / SO=protein_coding / is_pseudo=false